jgi:hypothetical protein
MAVAVGIAAAITMGATLAVAAHSKASPFELVVAGAHEAAPASPAFPLGIRHVGTFTAEAPFCASGTFADLSNDLLNGVEDSRLYTCSDGSGTLTVAQEDWAEHKFPWTDTWRILSGTDRYVGLRGKGTYRGEFISGDEEDPLSIAFRSTLRGFTAFDSVAPTITASSTKVTRLPRPMRTYAIRLGLSLHDNDQGNTISYTVAAEPGGGGLYLVERKGTTTTGRVAMTLRIQPNAELRTILLQMGAEDPVGNTRWFTRRLKLPR